MKICFTLDHYNNEAINPEYWTKLPITKGLLKYSDGIYFKYTNLGTRYYIDTNIWNIDPYLELSKLIKLSIEMIRNEKLEELLQ